MTALDDEQARPAAAVRLYFRRDDGSPRGFPYARNAALRSVTAPNRALREHLEVSRALPLFVQASSRLLPQPGRGLGPE